MAAPDQSPALRASDADREQAARQLQRHCADGRLTAEELDERTDAAYAARTVGELRALLADLPALPADPPSPSRGPGARPPDPARERAKRRLLHSAGSWVLIFLACVLVWALTGASGAFWPQWVALAAAVRLAFRGWALLGPGADDDARLGRGGSRPIERR